MTEFIEKLNILDRKLDNQFVHQQVKEVNHIISAVANQKILEKAPQPLGLLPDKLAEIASQTNSKNVKVMNKLLNSVRQYLSLRYGIWSLPNMTTVQLMKQELHIGSALEIMAGNAYWSKALNQANIQVIATDSLEWAKTSSTGQTLFYPVEDLSATQAIQKYKSVDLILCSWAPNFGDSDLKAVITWKKYAPHAHFLFIGEREGATNSEKFWQSQHFKNTPELAKINQSFVSYDFIDEKIFEIDEL